MVHLLLASVNISLPNFAHCLSIVLCYLYGVMSAKCSFYPCRYRQPLMLLVCLTMTNRVYVFSGFTLALVHSILDIACHTV